MYKKGKYIFAWLFVFVQTGCFIQAQNKVSDSLKMLMQNATSDSLKANALNKLASLALDQAEYAKAGEFILKALQVAEKGKVKSEEASAYNAYGTLFYYQADYTQALSNYKKALKLREETGNMYGAADCYNNIGNVLSDQGNYPESLRYYLTALKKYEMKLELSKAAGDKKLIAGGKRGVSLAFGNIGTIYSVMNNTTEALKYFLKGLQIDLETGNKMSLYNSYNNIGEIYRRMNYMDSALTYFLQSVRIAQEAGHKKGVGLTYNNLGLLYHERKDLKEAEKYYFSSIAIQTEIGDSQGVATSCINLGALYGNEKKYVKAGEYLNRALSISKQTGNVEGMKESYGGLADTYEAINDTKLALENYKKYIACRDSLLNEENTKKAVRLEMNYEFDKKEAAVKLEQEKKEAIAAADSRKQRIIIWSVCGILVLVFAFAVFAYRSYIQKQKANEAITKQKEIIEEKQKEILDSIHYAKRIQIALLPHEKYIERNLNELRNKHV